MFDWKTAYHLAFRTKMISEWLYVFANIELKYWIPILNEGWLFQKERGQDMHHYDYFQVFFTVVLFGKIGLLLYGLAFSIPKFQIQLLKLDTQSQCNLIGFRLVFLANDSSRRVLWGKQYRNGIPKPFWTRIFMDPIFIRFVCCKLLFWTLQFTAR